MSTSKKKTSKRSSKSKSLKIKVDLVDFDTWFWLKTRAGDLREAQKKEIKVFFEKRGLKDKELKSRYEEIIKLY